MAELKLCPFCGGEAKIVHSTVCAGHGEIAFYFYASCSKCWGSGRKFCIRLDGTEEECKEKAAEAWNQRVPEIVKVETSFYDQEEVFHNCTVQVLTNTATGETSVGWWKNG